MTMVMIDTSAWIHFLRDDDQRVADAVERAIAEDRAAITGPIVAELLQGVRSDSRAQELEELLEVVHREEVVAEDWSRCGATSRRLRERGTTLPLTDVVIATVAERCGCPVLTTDRDFEELPVDLVALGSD
jgi:hypothetical protein